MTCIAPEVGGAGAAALPADSGYGVNCGAVGAGVGVGDVNGGGGLASGCEGTGCDGYSGREGCDAGGDAPPCPG